LGHRPGRDPRLTTHVALVARAFGAERMYLNPPDGETARRLQTVADRWGGEFRVEGVDDWKALLREFPGTSVHLTMYGEPLDRLLPRLKKADSLLAIVGGAKVPAEVFQRSSFNLAVGSQPHSEVAALAILLDRLVGASSNRRWLGARYSIVPQARGKKVVARGSSR